MRDLHRVKERRTIDLGHGRLYGLAVLGVLLLGAAFALGYHVGKENAARPLPEEGPYISLDVQNETVERLLARAAEVEAAASSPTPSAAADLRFDEILPEVDRSLPVIRKRKKGRTSKKEAGNDKEKGTSKTANRGRSNKADSSPEREERTTKEGFDVVLPHASGGARGAESAARGAAPHDLGAVDKDGAGGQNTRGGKRYSVQVASFKESAVAERLSRQLRAQGFSAYLISAEVKGHTWYRVRVGAFERQEEAEKEMQRLKAARSELNPMIAHD